MCKQSSPCRLLFLSADHNSGCREIAAFSSLAAGWHCGHQNVVCCIEALLARLDQLAARPARLVSPAVHPQALFLVRAARGSSHSGIRHRLIAGRFGDIRQQKLSRCVHQAFHFFSAQASHPSKRIDSASEAYFRLKNISQARQ
jgi:hypothetical protein